MDTTLVAETINQSFWQANYQWISLLVQGLIAGAAVLAARAAFNSAHYASKTFNAYKKSLIAFLGPAPMPGHIKMVDAVANEIKINLVNYGQNPVEGAEETLGFFDKDFELIEIPDINTFSLANPLGPMAEWTTRYKIIGGEGWLIKHIKMEIDYKDRMLGIEQYGSFFWTVGERKRSVWDRPVPLLEPLPEVVQRLKKVKLEKIRIKPKPINS